jgi:putative restriction endonuclease
MSKAILTTKVDLTYDDLPEQRRHFPRTYVRQVEAARGDWIIYYEPWRASGDLMKTGGRHAYFATARITDIIEDPSKPDHFYALIEHFLPFDHAVPFKEAANYYGSGLRKDDGSTNKGAFGRAVRNISDAEYDLILAAGFAQVLGKRDRERPAPDPVEEARIGFDTIRRCRLRPSMSTVRSSLRWCSVRFGTGHFLPPSSQRIRTPAPSPA